MTASETTYQAGDQVDIGAASPITLCRRKGSHGVRWSWMVPATDLMGQTYLPTPEAAIADAIRAMNAPECRHGESGWCPTCHDASNR